MFGDTRLPPIGVVLMMQKVGSWEDDVVAPGWVHKEAAVDPIFRMMRKIAQEGLEEEEVLPPEAEAGLAHQQLAEQAQHNQQVALQAAAQMQQLQAQMVQLQQQAQQMQQQYEQQIAQLQQQLQQSQAQAEQLAQQLQVAQQSSISAQEQVLQTKKSVQDYRQMLAQLAGTDPTQAAAQAAPEDQQAAAQPAVPAEAMPSDVKKEVEQAQKSTTDAQIQQQQAEQKMQEKAPQIEQAAAIAQQQGLKAASFYIYGDSEPMSLLKTAVLVRKELER